MLGDIEAPGAWDQTRMHYRLAYADARVLHAYAFGRWAMPPPTAWQPCPHKRPKILRKNGPYRFLCNGL